MKTVASLCCQGMNLASLANSTKNPPSWDMARAVRKEAVPFLITEGEGEMERRREGEGGKREREKETCVHRGIS